MVEKFRVNRLGPDQTHRLGCVKMIITEVRFKILISFRYHFHLETCDNTLQLKRNWVQWFNVGCAVRMLHSISIGCPASRWIGLGLLLVSGRWSASKLSYILSIFFVSNFLSRLSCSFTPLGGCFWRKIAGFDVRDVSGQPVRPDTWHTGLGYVTISNPTLSLKSSSLFCIFCLSQNLWSYTAVLKIESVC